MRRTHFVKFIDDVLVKLIERTASNWATEIVGSPRKRG